MRKTKLLCLFILFLVMNYAGYGNVILQNAAESFEQGDFKVAIEGYTSALEEGPASFELYYNLGTCYAKIERLDLARLNLEKAILLKPADKMAKANIKWIKTELSENFAPLPEFLPKSIWKNVSAFIPYKIWYYLGFIFLCLAAFSLWRLLFLREKESKMKLPLPTLILALISAFVFLLLGNSRMRQLNIFKEYVILEKRLNVLAQPEIASETIQMIDPGSKVELISELGEWKEIIAEDGSKGWIRSNDLAKIEL